MIEFTSDRKRMSVIAKQKFEDGTYGKPINFIKGADIAIMKRLDKFTMEGEESTFEIMDNLAVNGLRTLMFAKKELSEDYDTIDKLKEVDDELVENGLKFLGITALEDLLQDNVADCVRDFQTAGIKVWMLTGDKGETANNIGISCGLIDKDKHLIYEIKSSSQEEL